MKVFPDRIVLELTPLCNLSCSMCPRHYIKETDGYMESALYKKLVDEIWTENSEAIVLPFWRGESCMHPHFSDLLKYTLDKGLRVHLSTNGHYMDDCFKDVFYHCEFVTFSLHDNRGYKNALKFVEEKPSWSKCTTQVSFVDVEKTTTKFLSECSYSPTLQGFDSIRLYHEHTIGGEFGSSGQDGSEVRTFCPKLEHTFVVSADGQYSRCNHIWTPERAGNLCQSTIKKIWCGERMEEIRRQYPDPQCAPCDQWSGHTNGETWRKGLSGNITHTVHTISK